ncbi:hypothetical protein [Patulibacter sp. SYSU D01012]|uniref:hypothetical protein n=1 Tax=Patulibacter sp. SYSU D01012 TaxID=2817381 RepID=UPI001B309495|nr:hypothetical protein [Patulibacter sp. SYSU D01012]
MTLDSHAHARPSASLGLRPGGHRLGRLRPRRARARTEAPAAATAPPPLPRARAEAGPRTIADLPLLVARLRGLGHTAWLEDHTGDAAVPAALSATVFCVLDETVEAIRRDGRPGQTLSIRVRVEDDALVVSVQNGGRLRVEAPDLDDADLAPLRRRIDAAGGDATVLPTAAGYWIAIARFPLDA